MVDVDRESEKILARLIDEVDRLHIEPSVQEIAKSQLKGQAIGNDAKPVIHTPASVPKVVEVEQHAGKGVVPKLFHCSNGHQTQGRAGRVAH